MASPTSAQVREQAATVRQRIKDARVIAIRADAWSGPGAIEIDRMTFRIAFCQSPLQVREELIELNGDGGLIVLTPASEDDLGSDVMVRFAKRQIFDIDTWRIALDLFKARGADPRVQRARWLADALVESAPPGGYDPVPAGVLDTDTVWDALLRHRIGFPDGRPDALTILRWAETPATTTRYTALPKDFRTAVRLRIQETAGSVGETMLDALDLAPNADLVSLGLACRVLFSSNSSPELRDAAIRFERFHHHHPLRAEVGLQWAEAAERLVAERESEVGWAAIRPRADRADRILGELGAGTDLHLGRWSPGGFEQRLAGFAATINQALSRSSTGDEVESAGASVLEHRLVRFQPARQRRVEMALRLVRWLRTERPAFGAALLDAAQLYCREGAFVDLARLVLLGGDQPEALGQAYAALLAKARDRREAENEQFGRRVTSAGAQVPSDQGALVPVERVLDEVVAPVAQELPVFMLVMDGLSRSVHQDLLQSIADEGWQLWNPERNNTSSLEWAALAAVPSVTEISRTSLLSGRLMSGDASNERREFAAHPALLQVSRSRRPPVLFHKADLLGPSGRGLSTEVRAALSDSEQRVVGAVVNVVDDLLFKGDQIQPRWSLDAAPVLRELFDAARVANRAVVLTSDHGHLLDDDTAFQGREAGERWREDTGEPNAGEVRVEGRRVLAQGRHSIIVPWSERTRYTGKRNGYHGGVSPQELVLPLTVMTWGETSLAGFSEAVTRYPTWWFEAAAVIAPSRPVKRVTSRAPVTVEAPLLDILTRDAPVASKLPQPPAWLDALFASDSLQAQKKLSSGRGLPADEEVRKLLGALNERGGRITRVALTQRLGVPAFRLAGLIAATRRLLNIDGLQVLDVDEASDTVVLNHLLLQQQFEIEIR